MPTLKSINSIPKLKDRSCDFLGRITCNLFQSHLSQRSAPQSGNVLERRTVDSIQISTISSLVDRDSRNAVHGGGSQSHDSQKENFGLYALKHTRSSASKRGSFHSQQSGRHSSVENQNHEHFQPCRASSIDSASSNHTVIHDEGGYCEIDLSDESISDEIINRVKSAKIKSNLNSKHIAEKGVESVVDSRRPRVGPPVPPKRVKSKLRQRKSQPQQQELYVPSEAPPSNDRQLVERSLHSQRNKLTAQKRFNAMETMNENDIHSVGRGNGSVQPKNEIYTKMGGQLKQINVSKNTSELYRIVGSNSRMITTATIEKYPQMSPSVRQIEATRRQLQRHSQSSVRSVDIFKSTNQSNAFDDFDEVLQIAPVVAVDRYSVANEHVDVNRNQNRLKRSNRVTIKNMEMGRRSNSGDRSKIDRGSNANTQCNKTWNLSADSNELTVYSHDKLHGDLDEEIIV